jgi:hypothetical protein
MNCWKMRSLLSLRTETDEHYVTNLCRKHVEIIKDHENENVRNTEQDEARYRKIRRLKFGSDQAYDRSTD